MCIVFRSDFIHATELCNAIKLYLPLAIAATFSLAFVFTRLLLLYRSLWAFALRTFAHCRLTHRRRHYLSAETATVIWNIFKRRIIFKYSSLYIYVFCSHFFLLQFLNVYTFCSSPLCYSLKANGFFPLVFAYKLMTQSKITLLLNWCEAIFRYLIVCCFKRNIIHCFAYHLLHIYWMLVNRLKIIELNSLVETISFMKEKRYIIYRWCWFFNWLNSEKKKHVNPSSNWMMNKNWREKNVWNQWQFVILNFFTTSSWLDVLNVQVTREQNSYHRKLISKYWKLNICKWQWQYLLHPKYWDT